MGVDRASHSPDKSLNRPTAARSSRRGRVRVLAADAHPMFRDALVRAIRERPEFELVASACDGREALHAIGTEQPDVAVIERRLPEVSGEQVVNAVSRDGLRTRIILMAAEPEPAVVYRTIVKGAAGYLTKDADARELCDAIAAVSRGQTVFGPTLQGGIAGEMRLRAAEERPFLSDREQEVLKLIAGGLSAPEIGRRLHLGTATIKTHLQHVYDKLGVSERAAAVAQAMRRGLLE